MRQETARADKLREADRYPKPEQREKRGSTMKLCRNRIAIVLICLLLVGIVPTAQAADGAGFSDVSSDAWYAEAVTWCEENGMMGGTSITEFSPDAVITRARLASVLWCGGRFPDGIYRCGRRQPGC